MMQAGIACHASAIMKPNRSLIGIPTLYITNRTQTRTYPATYTFLPVHGKMLVGNEVIVEETTKETAVETRECALVKMLSSTALANPFRELIKPYGCISDFLCFTESLIEIHERESDITLRHDNGI